MWQRLLRHTNYDRSKYICNILTRFERLRWNVESVVDEVAAEATHKSAPWTQHKRSNLKLYLRYD